MLQRNSTFQLKASACSTKQIKWINKTLNPLLWAAEWAQQSVIMTIWVHSTSKRKTAVQSRTLLHFQALRSSNSKRVSVWMLHCPPLWPNNLAMESLQQTQCRLSKNTTTRHLYCVNNQARPHKRTHSVFLTASLQTISARQAWSIQKLAHLSYSLQVAQTTFWWTRSERLPQCHTRLCKHQTCTMTSIWTWLTGPSLTSWPWHLPRVSTFGTLIRHRLKSWSTLENGTEWLQ